MHAQDKALQDAIATLDSAAPIAPVKVARVERDAREYRPTTGYRVTIAGTDIDVEASDHGDAVVRALTLKSTPAEFGGYVFLYRYLVTDSTGLTLDGGDRLMRDLLEAARIRRH